MNKLVKELKEGKKSVAIWGLGYIGYSSMAYFARAGIHCLGYDIIEERVKQINETGKIEQKGKTALPNVNLWLGFNIEYMHEDGLIKATTNWQELISNDYPVHLVAVPTEKKDEHEEHKPTSEYLEDIFTKLCEYKNVKNEDPPLVIIESTLSAHVLDDLIIPLLENKGIKVGKDLLIGVAPRRDWFVDPDKTLKTLPRVVGGTNKETTELITEVLSLICDTVLKAKDHNHASIVKSIENAYRQMDITLANQLSLAYPDIDMKHVLKLVGTKWNMQTYHPSFGIGGYCIPIAPYYVIEGAKNPEVLTLLKSSTEFEKNHQKRIVDSLVKREIKNVGILGISYSGDLKVHILSPALKIIKHLKENGINVKVNDPYYSDEELKEITKVDSFKFPEGLNQFDAILIHTPHMRYCHTPHQSIKSNLKNCKLILDNKGIWKDVELNPIEYHEAGDKNWLIE